MKYTETLWNAIEEIYGKILRHPFVTGLTDGTLKEESFRHYVIQDALYLRDYARGLALLAAKAPEDKWTMMFAEHARDTFIVERSLHESFFPEWGLTEKDVYRTTPSQTTLLYTSYLLRVAYDRPFHEGVGAFLPCYWIYWSVGKELERLGSPNALFQRWIDTYSGEEFEAIVEQVLEVTNSVVSGLTDKQKSSVLEHFVTTSKMEYLFWDMGLTRKNWDI